MNKLFCIIAGLGILTSCATSKVQEGPDRLTGEEVRMLRKAEVKQALESRRFLVRFDRMYTGYGNMLDLIPRRNYIIIDGDKVIISAAYVGRQYNYRPVGGINVHGRALTYESRNKPDKGSYHLRVKVSNDSNTFDLYIDISPEGYCDASVSNIRLGHVRYRGDLAPLKPRPGQGSEQEELQPEEAPDETV